MKEKHSIGGQAVIEGVMMRSQNRLAISVRKKGEIITKKENIKKRTGILRWPLIRGIVNLVDMMVVGIKALNWSADQQLGKKEKISKWEFFYVLAASMGFVILFFIVLPYYLTTFVSKNQGVLFNLVDGMIRIALFLAYLLLISSMKDVKRLFQYHGAEHKAVNCFEAGKKLSMENIKKYPTIHKRCGTTFILIVFMISIIVFSFIFSSRWYINIPLRISLMPVIAGISYEILKFSAKYDNIFTYILTLPGIWLQKLTTKEPTDRQIEVAVKSLKAVVR